MDLVIKSALFTQQRVRVHSNTTHSNCQNQMTSVPEAMLLFKLRVGIGLQISFFPLFLYRCTPSSVVYESALRYGVACVLYPLVLTDYIRSGCKLTSSC